MRNDPWRTYAKADYLISLGLTVFTLNNYGYPHKLCEACEHMTSEHMITCECLLCHSFYRATQDMDAIAEMLKQKPWAMLGIRTGGPLVVLDFDMHEGGADGLAVHEQWLTEDKLPATWTVTTGGGGIHRYYANHGPEMDTKPAFAPAVDLKSRDGYIVAPGFSKVAKNAYRADDGFGVGAMAELPSWITEAMVVPVRRTMGDGKPLTLTGTAAACSTALAQLQGSGAGSRNSSLYRLACRVGEAKAAGMSTEDIDNIRQSALAAALDVYANLPGWDEDNFDSVWDSGIPRGEEDAKAKAANPFIVLKRKALL